MSKVVFVGNVPYDVEEDKLIPIFQTVGPVAGFRLMIEKDTGKSKGYAFCEYHDHDTAASAVRNLNGREVNGRPLRIDLADSDPFFEGKTTQSGRTKPREDDRRDRFDPLANLPAGLPVPPGSSSMDMITKTLASIPTNQMLDILGQMKTYVTASPEHARTLFNAQPQLAYAFFQAMVINNLIDQSILERMLTSAALQAPAPPPPAPPIPPQTSYRPPAPSPAVPAAQYYSASPPAVATNPYSQPASYLPAAPAIPRPAPPLAATNPALAPGIPEDQRAMLMQILSLTSDQINALPPTERATVQALRAQFGA